MAKSKKAGWRRMLSNRRLISLEAVLLVGLLENYAESLVMQSGLPAPLKSFFIMLLVAGAFGLLMALVVTVTKRSLVHGNKLLQSLPIPTPLLLVHGAALGGIYWLYATQW